LMLEHHGTHSHAGTGWERERIINYILL